MMTDSRFASPPFLCVLLVLGAGCNKGPQVGSVQGVMTFDGQPIREGSVQFYPVLPGPMAAGVLRDDGAFELTTKRPGDGAIVGEHIVVVTPPSSVNMLEKELKEGQPPPRKHESIPHAFRNRTSSTLRANVQPGSNRFEFDLSKELSR